MRPWKVSAGYYRWIYIHCADPYTPAYVMLGDVKIGMKLSESDILTVCTVIKYMYISNAHLGRGSKVGAN